MPDVADPQIKDTLSVENLKTIAGSSASAQAKIEQAAAAALGMLLSDAAAASSRRNNLADAAMGQAMIAMTQTDPSEAISTAKMMSGNDLAQTLAQLLAAVNTGTQSTKSAGNTPPVTP